MNQSFYLYAQQRAVICNRHSLWFRFHVLWCYFWVYLVCMCGRGDYESGIYKILSKVTGTLCSLPRSFPFFNPKRHSLPLTHDAKNRPYTYSCSNFKDITQKWRYPFTNRDKPALDLLNDDISVVMKHEFLCIFMLMLLQTLHDIVAFVSHPSTCWVKCQV